MVIRLERLKEEERKKFMANSIDFERMQNFIDAMYAGDVSRIKEGIVHPGAIIRINAVFSIAENNLRDEEVIRLLNMLKEDDTVVDGIRVGDYAVGLLDVFGLDTYTGNSPLIRELIEDGMLID